MLNRTYWKLPRWLLFLFILANLALAAPVVANWRNETCWDPEKEVWVQCCTKCTFFCHCDFDDGP